MGWGTLTTSQRITARADLTKAADELADAVENYWNEPSAEGYEFTAGALDRYRAARAEARR